MNDESAAPAETKIPCLVYARIVGYITPTSNWNKGKLQEEAERKMFKIEADKEN